VICGTTAFAASTNCLTLVAITMGTCGNRAKVQAFRARQRASSGP